MVGSPSTKNLKMHTLVPKTFPNKFWAGVVFRCPRALKIHLLGIGGLGVGVGNLIFFVGGVEAPSAPERSIFWTFLKKVIFQYEKVTPELFFGHFSKKWTFWWDLS